MERKRKWKKKNMIMNEWVHEIELSRILFFCIIFSIKHSIGANGNRESELVLIYLQPKEKEKITTSRSVSKNREYPFDSFYGIPKPRIFNISAYFVNILIVLLNFLIDNNNNNRYKWFESLKAMTKKEKLSDAKWY